MDDKSKIFALKNFVKQENGRLTSLTVPRDLSLGGSKPKKIYTPNLNVVRNKVNIKSAPVKTNQKREFTRESKQINKNLNNGRYVQSTGVFSDGTAHIKRPTLHSDKHSTTREADTSVGLIKPKIANSWNVDVKEEADIVQDLLTCEEDSESDNDGEYEPIVLPLSANYDGFMNTFKIKKEPPLKSEQDLTEQIVNGFRSMNGVKCENMYSYNSISSFANFSNYDEDNVSMSLVKFPDSLPGKGFDEENKIIDYNLKDMVEGKIGKILVRKSGKIDVVIGKTNYTLDSVQAAQFKEEVMCMSETAELNREPAITNLGAVNEKFVISPIWPNLLSSRKK